MSALPWSVWMALPGIMQCPDCAAVCGGTTASQWPLGSCTSFQLLILPLHFSVCFSSGLWTKVVWTERAELSLVGAFLLISPRTALYPCSWLPPSPLLLFPSLRPPRIYEWRPLDSFCNKPWVTPLKRGVGFGNNVKNCEILPVWGAQPSFGQWIMALAKMFSLQSPLTSLEEWKLLPAKIGSFSAPSASMALPPSLVVWFCTLPLSLCPSSSWATVPVNYRRHGPNLKLTYIQELEWWKFKKWLHGPPRTLMWWQLVPPRYHGMKLISFRCFPLLALSSLSLTSSSPSTWCGLHN